ncbi:cytochrome P450 [Russula vinacea]|nr:cytochrome P450 [Russula vinacea]
MPDELTVKTPFFVGVILLVFLFLDAIPTVGFSDPILSYFSAIRYIFDDIRMLKDGYEKTRLGLFKIARFRRWMVLVAGPSSIDDVRRAPDDALCRVILRQESLQSEYTLDILNPKDRYTADVIRSKLTRDVANTFKEVNEELVMTLDDLIPAREDKWVKVPILETLQQVVCRTTNRVFVGVPLCRDHDYLNLNIGFAANLLKSGMIISLFPKPLKRIVSRMLSNLPSQIQQEIEFIRPMVDERFAKMEEYGEDWDDKPNDLLMWLMDEAKGVERSAEGLARRLLTVNLASIHSTSLASCDIPSPPMTLTQVLYRLLANPEYIELLRQEVDTVIAQEGWTKSGMDKLHKTDSFIREVQRIDGLASVTMDRLTLRPATHKDGRIYANPDEFDGLRFVKLRESEATSRHQVVSTSSEHLVFGLGRHTCPGRFFVANEMKALLAHIVTTYDIKFEEGKGVPREYSIAGLRFPGSANVMFRIRQK